jgi:hypothetical protein
MLWLNKDLEEGTDVLCDLSGVFEGEYPLGSGLPELKRFLEEAFICGRHRRTLLSPFGLRSFTDSREWSGLFVMIRAPAPGVARPV